MINFNDYKRMNMSNDIYILGVLAYNRENYPRIGKDIEPVTTTNDFRFDKEPNIVFFIEPISNDSKFARNLNEDKLPKDIVNDIKDLYIGFDNQHFNSNIHPFCQSTTENIDYKNKTGIEKKEIVYNTLGKKILLFRPNIQRSNSGDLDYNKNLKLEEILDIEYKSGSKYKTIPEVYDNSFEYKIYFNKPIKLVGFNHEMIKNPEAIIFDDYIYCFNENEWEKVENTEDEWIYLGKNNSIKKYFYDVSNNEVKDGLVIELLEHIVFIEEEFFNSKFNNEENKENNDIDEITFLNQLFDITNSSGLNYDFSELVNLHISIKTNPLTIISGMSGTGKSKLATSYVKSIGCNNEDLTYLFLPISPSYIEPKDILGYFDSKTNTYIPSETGFVDLLINSSKNPDKLHFVIFDEMNLSQVEYWFAPFISLLELNENRILRLYSKHINCKNSDIYPSEIIIGDNIRFIGTVNLDETTKEFSDRVLDRANLVTIKRKSLRDFINYKTTYDIYMSINKKNYTFSNYKRWINNSYFSLNDFEIEFLDKLNDLLEKYDSNKGVSLRTCDKIESYIKNIPIDENQELLIPRDKAFDIQIKQRILTKLRGSNTQLQDIINQVNSPIINLFDEYSMVSDFSLCKDEISKKLKELNLYGYTI